MAPPLAVPLLASAFHEFAYAVGEHMTATADPSSPSVGASHHMVFIYMVYNEISHDAKHPSKANLGLIPVLVIRLLRRRTHGMLMQEQRQGEDGPSQLTWQLRTNGWRYE